MRESQGWNPIGKALVFLTLKADLIRLDLTVDLLQYREVLYFLGS